MDRGKKVDLMKSRSLVLLLFFTLMAPHFCRAEVQDIVPIPLFKVDACGEPASIYSQCGAGEGYLLGVRTLKEFLAARPSQIKCPREAAYSKVTGVEVDTTLGVTRTFFPYVCCCYKPGVITSIEPEQNF